MFNEVVIAKFLTCLEHVEQIDFYLKTILNSEEFLLPHNAVYYDAILMRLQTLGENIKAISKKHPEAIAFLAYKDITNFIRFRDLVSHHYEKLEHDIIYDICIREIPLLKERIEVLLKNR